MSPTHRDFKNACLCFRFSFRRKKMHMQALLSKDPKVGNPKRDEVEAMGHVCA